MKKYISLFILLIILIYIGILLRLKNNFYTSEEYYANNNVVSYYVDISNNLIEKKSLLKIDNKRYSNKEFTENAPPFLAIITSFLYTNFNFFRFSSFDYIALFNLILYAILFIVFAIFFIYKKNNVKKGLFFLFLLTFLPVSIYISSYGRYTEEFLGVFFIFLISIAEIYRDNKISSYLETIFLIFLVLTWQQFHIIFFILFISNLFFRKTKFIETCFILFFSLIFAEFFSKFIFLSNYSPFQMLYEAIYPILGNNSEVVNNVMYRRDWNNLNFKNFINYFGYFGLFLFIFSILNFFIRKEKKYKDFYLFIGTFITFLLMYFFIKSRFIFLPFFLLFIIYNLDFLKIELFKKYLFFLKKISFIFIFLLLIYLVLNYRSFVSFSEKPNIIVESSFIKDNSEIKLRIKNTGGNQLLDSSSFSGMHIEVFNAEVSNIKINYFYGISQIVIKKDANMKDYYWFEIKLNEFNKNKYADVIFSVKKKDENSSIIVKYRSWIPMPCSLIDRSIALYSLLPDYTSINNSWRNENCILRAPVNNSKEERACSYRVHAAFFEQQDFKCYEKIF